LKKSWQSFEFYLPQINLVLCLITLKQHLVLETTPWSPRPSFHDFHIKDLLLFQTFHENFSSDTVILKVKACLKVHSENFIHRESSNKSLLSLREIHRQESLSRPPISSHFFSTSLLKFNFLPSIMKSTKFCKAWNNSMKTFRIIFHHWKLLLKV